jgi:hypothetical protein
MQVWRKHNLNVLKYENMQKYNKFDTVISLAASMSPVFTIFIFPLSLFSYFGYNTTFFGETIYHILWLFVIIAPFATALLVWILDSMEYGMQSFVEIPISALLLPYILLQFAVNWLALMDEFILKRPSSFVKTERDIKDLSSFHTKKSIAGLQSMLISLNLVHDCESDKKA